VSKLAAATFACVLAAGCSGGKPLWDALPLGTRADFDDIWFVDAMHGWIAGGSYEITGGLIGRTSDGGKTWSFVSNLTDRDRLNVGAIHFFDANRGIAAASSGAILATTDSGATWFSVARKGHVVGLSTVFFLDERRGWAAGTGDVIRTDDAGEHWSPLSSDATDASYRSPIRAIQFLDEHNGWVAGMQSWIARTTDGGGTWQPVGIPIVGPERPTFWDLSFVDSECGWVVGEEGAIISTTDAGMTWTRRSTGLTDAHSAPKLEQIPTARGPVTIDAGDRTPGLTISAVRFIDRNRGWITGFYAGLGRSLILRTEDAGATWVVEADIPGEELRTLFIHGRDTAWAIGSRVREGTQSIYRRALDGK
jgi:photosystem II stability/assembly factor-like uncharacterized protein